MPDSDSLVHFENIPFIFPCKEDGHNNNIECYNNVINFQSGYYKSIYFLGSCDNGSFKEKINLIYEYVQDIFFLPMTDWVAENPLFGELKAVNCTHVHSSQKDLFKLKPKIWMQRVKINPDNKLVKIRLPDNPCLHIFSITLEGR